MSRFEDQTPAVRSRLVLPVGTQVVTRGPIATGDGRRYPAGAVGVIERAPVDHQHAYRIRFPDGGLVSLRRDELAIRKQVQRSGLEAARPASEADDLVRF